MLHRKPEDAIGFVGGVLLFVVCVALVALVASFLGPF